MSFLRAQWFKYFQHASQQRVSRRPPACQRLFSRGPPSQSPLNRGLSSSGPIRSESLNDEFLSSDLQLGGLGPPGCIPGSHCVGAGARGVRRRVPSRQAVYLVSPCLASSRFASPRGHLGVDSPLMNGLGRSAIS